MQLITPFLVSKRQILNLRASFYYILQVFAFWNLCVCQYGGGGGSGGCDDRDCNGGGGCSGSGCGGGGGAGGGGFGGDRGFGGVACGGGDFIEFDIVQKGQH